MQSAETIERAKKCFGLGWSFERYQILSALILGSMVALVFWLGWLSPTWFVMAALMTVFDLPAVIAVGVGVFAHGFWTHTVQFSWLNGGEILLGIFLGHYLAAILHNGAHRNFGIRWLNRPIGEAAGFLLTYGFGTFRAVHRLHHTFTDQELDPHSPHGQKLIQFMFGVRGQIVRNLARSYHLARGKGDIVTSGAWRAISTLIVVNRTFRLALLLACLGPQTFTLIALPCYVVNFLVFTVFNYKMHIREGTEDILVQNLDQTFYQRVINRTCHGVLFHENHHNDGNFFDPRRSDARTQFPLVHKFN